MKCEVTDTESVNAAFDEAEQLLGGPVDVLVANAGITRDTLLMRISDEEFDDVIATNLAGALKCARRASKGMIRLRRGRIVLISSVVGLYGAPGQANYAASKSGLVGLARSITRELGGRGITANVVSPGFIDTEMTQALPEKVRESYLAAIPAGRFARAGGGRERGAVHREPRGRIHQWRRDPGRRWRRHGSLSLVLQQPKGAQRGHP